MPIVDINTIKSKFEAGDRPGVSDYINMIDTLAALPEAGTGPQGPQGIQGEAGPTGSQGPQGIQGIQGIQGEPGVGLTLKGTVALIADLLPTGNLSGDGYIVEEDGGHLWVWDGSQWNDVGQIVGPQGPQGIQGEQGIPEASGGELGTISVSSNITLSNNNRYFVDTSAVRTLTLPASPEISDEIQIIDSLGTSSQYNITIARNGNKINGQTDNLVIDTNGGWYTLVYTGATYGWKVG